MSLHVDLIYPGEQRSGAIVTLRSAGRIAAITIPLIIAVLIGRIVVRNMQSASALAALETHWEITEARQQKARQLTIDLLRNREILDHLEGWRKAALPWAPQLYALVEVTPPTIQLRQLSAQAEQTLINQQDNQARRFTMRLTGTTREENATDAIAILRGAFARHAAWSDHVDTALVMRFGQDDSPGAETRDRVFEIEVVYHPLEFK